jgi:hypothetical protein
MSKVVQFYGVETADKVEILCDSDGCSWVRYRQTQKLADRIPEMELFGF